MRKRTDDEFSMSTEKSQSPGPPFFGETLQASFLTGTVDHRIGIFLSPLNTNDRFYFSLTNYISNVTAICESPNGTLTVLKAFMLYPCILDIKLKLDPDIYFRSEN